MAPGCYSPSANKDIVMKDESQQPQQQQQQAMETLSDFANKSSILEICIDTPVDYTFHFVSSPLSTKTTTDDLLLNSCNLIPLPSTPPPPRSSRFEDEQENSSDDEEEDDDSNSSSSSSSDESSCDEEEEDDETSSEEEEEDEEETVKKEADTFEILEQTIMKQKRLAKLKNTDLRRKVLLKRTFDLVLEIMDAENGFNDDEPDCANNDSTPMLSQATNTTSEEDELILNSSQQQHQQQQPLELELHPDDGKNKTQFITTTPILSTSNHNSTTLNVCVSSVKLVDYDLDDDQDEQDASTTTATTPTTTTTIQIDQARVPRQLKRRSSASDEDEEDNDEDDEERDEDSSQLDDHYEYSTIYTNDQELNYRRSTHHLTECVSAHDLNIYNDNVQIQLEKTRTPAPPPTTSTQINESMRNKSKSSVDSRRSDHPRKKLRAA